jgi:2-desacetyl-2-hydroxyethyl bacteriochlorophyllide A dehydrogenase
MKAIWYNGPKDVRYETCEDPKIEDVRDVIVKTTLCGLCGSDLHFYHGELKHLPGHYCLGHEAVGEVVEAGPAVSSLKVGDRVMLPALTGCGQCRACLEGNLKRCENRAFKVYGMGSGLGGCQAEAIRVPAGDFNAVRIAEGISDKQAILLTDNLPTAYGACIDADFGPGRSVAVIGLGAIGLICVELAVLMGASVVYAIDLVPERRERARQLGATVLGDGNTLEEVRALTKGKMVDSVVEAAGGDITTTLAFGLVGVGGTVSILGVNADMKFQMPRAAFVMGVTIRANFMTEVNKHWSSLIPLLQSGRLRSQQFISDEIPLSEGPTAYERFDRREGGTLKMVFLPGR